MESADTLRLLLDCCAAWLTANAGGTQRPRWLTSSTSSSSAGDSALFACLSSALSPASPSWPLRLSAVAFFSALAKEHAGRETQVHAWLSSTPLLAALLELCHTRCVHWSTRARSLCEGNQVRVLTSIFSDGAAPSRGMLPTTAVSVDCQQEDGECLALLGHLWTLFGCLAAHHRHDDGKGSAVLAPSCPLCDGDTFMGLVEGVRLLWSSHRDILSALASTPTASGTVSPASPTVRVTQLLTNAWSALMAFVQPPTSSQGSAAGILFSPPSDSLSQAGPTSATLCSFLQLTAEVVRGASAWRVDEAMDSRTRQSAVALLPPIASLLKRSLSRWDPPADPSHEPPCELECRPSLFDAVHAVLAAGQSVAAAMKPVSSSPARLSVDSSDDCIKAALQLHTAFISHYRQAVVADAAIGLSCAAFLPFAAAVLANASATLDVLHLVFASLQLLLQACQPSLHHTSALLALLARLGLIDASWQSADALRLACQSQPAGSPDRRATAAWDASRKWNAAVMAAVTWTGEAVVHVDGWQKAVTTAFAGDDPHSWQRTLQGLQQGQLQYQGMSLLLYLVPLCLISLVSRTVRTRAAPSAPPAPLLAVQFQEREVLKVVQQVVMSPEAGKLNRSTLVLLLLLAVVLEDDYRLSLAAKGSKAKTALLALVLKAGLGVEDLTLHPSLPSHVTEKTVTHWLWRQSPSLQPVTDLHDHLLLAALAPASASGPQPPLGAVSARALQWVAEEANALKALVRRWAVAVDMASQGPPKLSAVVSELLRFTHRLIPLIPPQRALTAGLLEPIGHLADVGYHRLLRPSTGADDVASSGLAASLLSVLLTLLSAATVFFAAVERSVRLAAFRCGTELLLAHDQAGRRLDGDVIDRAQVQLMSLQLCTAVLLYEQKTGGDAAEHREALCAPSVRTAISSLLRLGQSLATVGVGQRAEVSNGGRRVALNSAGVQAAEKVDEEQIRALRLQLQLAGMELSTILQRGRNAEAGDQSLCLLTGEELLPLLHHRCSDVRVVVLRYLSRMPPQATDGEGEGSGATFGVKLLLSVQTALLPHQPALLSAAALSALSSLLSSSTSDGRRELLLHPWHSFVVQSALFALSQADVSLRSTWTSAGVLLRYLHLLGDKSASVNSAQDGGCHNEGNGYAGERCVARLHLAAVDSRLLLSLLSFLPLEDGAGKDQDVCISSAGHFVSTLLHLHHGGCLPLSAASSLTPRLVQLQSVVMARVGAASSCPASTSRSHPAAIVDSSPSQPSYSQLSASQGSVGSPSATLYGLGDEEMSSAADGGGEDMNLCQCEESGEDGQAVLDVRQLQKHVGEKIDVLLRLLRR